MIEIKRLFVKTIFPGMYMVEMNNGNHYVFNSMVGRHITENDLSEVKGFNGRKIPYEDYCVDHIIAYKLFGLDETGGATDDERLPAWDDLPEKQGEVWRKIGEIRCAGEGFDEIISYTKGDTNPLRDYTETLCVADGMYFLICKGGRETKYGRDTKAGQYWEYPLTKNGAHKYISERFGEDKAIEMVK